MSSLSSLSKCANEFISPHRVCTIKRAAHCTVRLTQELSQFTCIIAKVYNLHCFLSLPIFKLFITRALSSVHSQQLPHCKNKNTQHDQTFNLITYFFGGKKSKYFTLHHSNKKINPPSHKSNLRGEFTPFSKMKLRT